MLDDNNLRMKLLRYLFHLFKELEKTFYPSIKYARKIGVTMGNNNLIPDKDTWSSEPYLVTIGSNCQITKGVKLFTHGGGQAVRQMHPDFDVFGKIVIGDNVYIGMNSLIMPGVTIADNVIVAAGSVVTKSVPKNVVVAGNPAKIICTISDYYERNKKYDLHSKRMGSKEKKIFLLNQHDTKFIKKKLLDN